MQQLSAHLDSPLDLAAQQVLHVVVRRPVAAGWEWFEAGARVVAARIEVPGLCELTLEPPEPVDGGGAVSCAALAGAEAITEVGARGGVVISVGRYRHVLHVDTLLDERLRLARDSNERLSPSPIEGQPALTCLGGDLVEQRLDEVLRHVGQQQPA